MKRIVCLLALSGCSAFNRSVLPADFAKNGECVAGQILAGDTEIADIEAACFPGQLQSAIDAVELLLAGQFGELHPHFAATIIPKLAAARK